MVENPIVEIKTYEMITTNRNPKIGIFFHRNRSISSKKEIFNYPMIWMTPEESHVYRKQLSYNTTPAESNDFQAISHRKPFTFDLSEVVLLLDHYL